MGCPVPKVVNNGEGSALMKDPVLVGRIVEKMADALDDAFEVIEDNSPAILEMLCNNSYNSGLDCRKKLKRDK